jgi:DNA-binding PadR family transcriptional regulator
MGRETKPLSEMLALWAVQREGPASPSEVAETLSDIGVSRSTAYAALSSLSEQGLVEESRTTTPGGAPRVTYSATPAAAPMLRPLLDLLKGKKR